MDGPAPPSRSKAAAPTWATVARGRRQPDRGATSADPAYLFIKTLSRNTEDSVVKLIAPLTTAKTVEAVMLMGRNRSSKGASLAYWRVRPAGPIKVAINDSLKIAAHLNTAGNMPEGWFYVQPWSSCIACAVIIYEWAEAPRLEIAKNLETALKAQLPGIEVLGLVPERAPGSGPSNGRFLVTARFPEGRPPRGPTTLRLNGWGCSFSWSGMGSSAKPGSKEWNHWGMIHDLRSEARGRSAKRKERLLAKKHDQQPTAAKPASKAGTKPGAKAGAEAGEAGTPAPPGPTGLATIDDAKAAAAKAKEVATRALALVAKADSELKLHGQPLADAPDFAAFEASASTVKASTTAASIANDAACGVAAAVASLREATTSDPADGDNTAALDAAEAAIQQALAAADIATQAAAKANEDGRAAQAAIQEAKAIAEAKLNTATTSESSAEASAEAARINNVGHAVQSAVKAAAQATEAAKAASHAAEVCQAAASALPPAPTPPSGTSSAPAEPSAAAAAGIAQDSTPPPSSPAPAAASTNSDPLEVSHEMDEAPINAKRNREDEDPEENSTPTNRSSARTRKARREADGVLGVDNTILSSTPAAKKPPPRPADPPVNLWLKRVNGKNVPVEKDANEQPQLPPARAKPSSSALSALRPTDSSRAPAEGRGST